ncbi:ABC transporter permease [Opitutaceae bacterium TAV3]|nr:ABC transporter permease [Opitutaceae bacterium TAV3]
MTCTVFKREFLGYFRSPVAYVFLIVFLVASVGLAFFIGNFFKANLATLESYFMFHPWLFLFFAPAAGMRLWAEEKRSGTLELLFTLPITTLQAVMGKFLAAWAFLALAVLLSFPMALTVGYLGNPDWGVIASSYLGSILMAGGFLGICSLTSALTRNQVISFVLSVIVCLVLVLLGWSVFNGALGTFLPAWGVDLVANTGFIPHFDSFTKGIIDPKDLIYFLSLMGFDKARATDSTKRTRQDRLFLPAWENTRGEKGPWSPIYSAIIP